MVVPTKSVQVDGTPTVAWFDFNPVTGETIAESQSGEYQGIALYVAIYGTGVVFTQLSTAAKGGPTNVDIAKGIVEGLLFGALVGFFIEEILIAGIISTVLNAGFDAFVAPRLPIDPPLATMTTGLNVPFPNTPPNSAGRKTGLSPTQAAGQVRGALSAPRAVAAGQITASWASDVAAGFLASSLHASAAALAGPGGRKSRYRRSCSFDHGSLCRIDSWKRLVRDQWQRQLVVLRSGRI